MLGMTSPKVETKNDKYVAGLLLRVLQAEGGGRDDGDKALLAVEIGFLASQQNITPDTLVTMTELEITQFFEGMVGIAETSRGVEDFALDVTDSKTDKGRRWRAIANKVARSFDS
jgi:hypothetical protein